MTLLKEEEHALLEAVQGITDEVGNPVEDGKALDMERMPVQALADSPTAGQEVVEVAAEEQLITGNIKFK